MIIPVLFTLAAGAAVELPQAAARPPTPKITLYINDKPVELTPGLNIIDPTEKALTGGKGFRIETPQDYYVTVDLHTTFDDQTGFCFHPIHRLGALNSNAPTLDIKRNTEVGCVGVIVKKK